MCLHRIGTRITGIVLSGCLFARGLAAAEEASAGAEEQTASAEEIAASAEELTASAQSLQTLVGQFRY